MPVLELAGFPQEKIAARNAIIRGLAAKHHMPFVDPSALQKKISNDPSAFSWKKKSLWFVVTEITMVILPFFKDIYPKTRNLKVTVDGAHFSKESAKVIGETVDSALVKQSGSENTGC